LGIANALVTDLATAAAQRDTQRVRRLISTATALLAVIGALLAVVAFVLPTLVDIDGLFGVSSKPSGIRTASATIAYLVVLGASLPLSAALRVLTSIHRSDLTAKVTIASAGAQLLLGALVAVTNGGLTGFAAVAAGSASLSGALAWVLAVRVFPMARPSPRAVDCNTARRLVARGGAYFTISVAGAIGFETDAFVIANRLGHTDSATYVVPAKLFLLVPGILALYFTPLWPSVARARAEGDGSWLRANFRRSLVLAFGTGTIASVGVALVVRPAMAVLSPATPKPSAQLVATLTALAVVHSVSAPVASFLSGLGLVGIQAVSAGVMAVANLGASLVLVRSIGLTGPPLATVGCQLLITLIPLIVVLKRRLALVRENFPTRAEPQ
jgi:O-antigen/teichoic acid export membrane protein